MMDKRFTYKILALVFVFATLVSCQGKVEKSAITVSILPQKYLVQKLLGDSIPVNVLIPMGSSPATYEPTPVQVKNLSRSKVYLRIGHIGFEKAWTSRIAEISPELKIVDTSEGITLIKGEDHVHGDHVHEGGIDPHIWTSPKTMLLVLENTTKALLELFPEKKAQISQRSSALEKKIIGLHNAFEKECSRLGGKSFYIFHPAYTYLARDYGLEQISIEHNGKEPSVKWIGQLIDDARRQDVKVIFVQKEFDKRSAELIANELEIPIVEVNPLSEKWEEEMRDLLGKLKKALG